MQYIHLPLCDRVRKVVTKVTNTLDLTTPVRDIVDSNVKRCNCGWMSSGQFKWRSGLRLNWSGYVYITIRRSTHGDTQEIPRRYPRDTQEIPRRYPRDTQEIPRRYPRDTQEIPRRYRGDTQEIPRRYRGDTEVIPRRYPRDTQEIPR
ncbi:hypothetical protein Btru_065167 [Bulinus truncatus]|nr:hypothetical protein Btru_065167 [Bulinus truncatus]